MKRVSIVLVMMARRMAMGCGQSAKRATLIAPAMGSTTGPGPWAMGTSAFFCCSPAGEFSLLVSCDECGLSGGSGESERSGCQSGRASRFTSVVGYGSGGGTGGMAKSSRAICTLGLPCCQHSQSRAE